MEYKIETHCHTSEVSPCGVLHALEIVEEYHKAGYNAILITDHYVKWIFNKMKGTWDDKIDTYLSGYKTAKKAAEQYNINILLGMELRFFENMNDYIISGFDEAFLRSNPALYNYTLDGFVHDFMPRFPKLLIIQAHPNRPVITPQNPDLLDGFEIANLNPRHAKYSDARNYSNLSDKIFTSGSDCHQLEDVGIGGITSDTLPRDSFEYADLLRSGKYELLGMDLL